MSTVFKQRPWVPSAEATPCDFTNATIVDPVEGTVHPGSRFRVAGGNIVQVWPDGTYTPSDEAETGRVVDLGGKHVCPGLIDCHVHLTAAPGDVTIKGMFSTEASTTAFRSAYLAKTMLLRGFTTVRDTGGADAGLKDALDEGLIKGPRLFIAGKALSQTGGHGDFRSRHEGDAHKCCGGDIPGLSRVCDGVPQCLEAVRDEIRKGADFIKIMCGGGVATLADPIQMVQFTAEEIAAIATTAGYAGKLVTAHAYTPQAIRHAVDNGALGIEHANLIDAETAALCKERGVTVTPTLVVYQAYEDADEPPFSNLLTAAQRAKNREVLVRGLDSLRILRDAGVTMCYGSDLLSALHPLQLHEFSIRSQVLSPLEILQSATTNAARYLGMDGLLGEVKVGAYADFIVLDGSPLEDIAIFDRADENLLAIVKDGRVVASKVHGLDKDSFYQEFEL